MRKIILYVFTIIFIFIACNKRDAFLKVNSCSGKKMNLMNHAVKLYNIDTDTLVQNTDYSFKIVTYTNLYCEPCWNEALKWKDMIKYFEQYPNVAFFFYVHSTPEDFDSINVKAQIKFPVYLDLYERFKIVNKLGNDPRYLTFLLNRNNEVLLIGAPNSEAMKRKYLSIIEKK